MDICELIPSQKGKDKLNVHEYLFLQNKRHGKHYLYGQNNDQNHAPEASIPKIANILSTLNQQAGTRTSRDKPAQIIQSIFTPMDINNDQSMPSKDAMHQQIKRVGRQNVMSEPTSLDSLFIPEELKHRLNGEPFLINESEIRNDKILLFTTLANLLPIIFHQLYSVYAPVGHDTNSRILPLVFALLSSKFKQCYIRMFQDLQDYTSENNIVLQPDYILTDFEEAAIYAVKQDMWRKVQSVGLSIKYDEDEEFSLLTRHLLNYVLELWSVFNQNIPRTQNTIEAWHRCWECLVGESHIGVYHLIKELQKEQKNTEIMIESIFRGVPRPHSKKKNEQREVRIQNVIQNQGNVPVMEFLRGIAYNMTS
ncbi:hypothetical protein QTP88_013562 [Uroleucon formosanum]